MNTQDKTSLWFKITKQDQYLAINELILESKEAPDYYIFLVLSSIIISAGLLLANSAILIGGMLITPLLTPILSIGLGLITSNFRLVERSTLMVLKSVAIIFMISFIVSLVFSIPHGQEFFSDALFNNRIEAAFLYFLIAFASGFAATFAWIKKKTDSTLPGISIVVSLVPPISLVAIWLGSGEFDLMRFFLMVFLFNIVGIIGGSMVLFSIFKFYRSAAMVYETVERTDENNLEEHLKLENNDEGLV